MSGQQRLALWLPYLARRLGVPGWLGLLSLLMAAALWALWVQPATERLHSQQQRLRAQLALAQQSGSAAARDKTPTEQLFDFYAHFGTRTQVPKALEHLQALARRHKLELESGDYSYLRTDGQRLDQLRISLPIRGTYVQIRQFVEQVLKEQPDIALQSLSLRRDKLAQDVVEGRVVLILFVDGRGGGA